VASLSKLIVLILFVPLVASGQIYVDQLNVDNIRLDGNTLSTTNTDGDFTIDINGAGSTVLADLTATTVPYLDASKKIKSSAVTPTELGRLTGVSSTLCGISDACTLTNKSIDADTNTLTNIENADVKAAAGIAYSKLNLGTSIVNADINGSAAIAYSKLNLATSIVNADISASAAIDDTKLATISTASKVSNSATTATDVNTNSAIVARDGSGNFSATTISAALTGNASTATALAANPADCSSDTYATTIAASGALTCATVTNAGLAGSIAASKLVATDITTIGTITSGTWTGTTIALANGGTGQATKAAAFDALSPMTTVGDIIIGGASGTGTRFAKCSDGQIIKYAAGTVGCGADTTGAGSLGYRAVASADSTTASDGFVKLSGASFTLTLHTAVGNTGQILELGHQGTSLTQIYTLATTSSQTIGGIASGVYILYTKGETLKLISDGANWLIVSHAANTAPASYTPATHQGFGTVTATTYTWWRIGSTCFVQATWTNGTVSGSQAQVSIPDNITHAVTIATPGTAVGTFVSNSATSPSTVNLISGNAFFTLSGPGVNMGPTSGSTASNNSLKMTIFASFPVSGWQP